MNIILNINETMQDLVDRLAYSFQLVNDIAPVAYWYENLHPNGRIIDIHFSARLREMLGYNSEEEFPDDLQSFMSFLHPDDVQGMLDAAIAAGTGKTDGYDIRYRIRRADGSYMWARATGEIVIDQNGTTVGMYGGFIDVTNELLLKEQQEKLQEAYNRLDTTDRRNYLLHKAVKAITWFYEINANDEVVSVYYDHYVEENTNVKMKNNPMSWVDALHPEDKERVLSEFMEVIHDHTCNTPYESTYRLLQPDGTYFWVKTSGRLSRREDGTAELVGISINITAQMEAQQKRLLGAVPISPDILAKENIGMWAFELDEGQPPRMYGDDAMIKLVGLDHQVPPEEMYHAWYDHIDEGSYQLVQDAVDKMMSGEHAEVQYPWHHPDGYTMIVRCGGVRNPEYTRGIRVEGTHQNVTEVLHYDEEEIQRQKQADSVKKMMNMLFSLSSEYDPIIVVEPESGEYDWYMGQADELTVNTSMTMHGESLYKNIGIDSASIIHPEDRAQFQAFYTRENMCRIVETGEPQETENRWFLKLEGRYKWKYNKAVRMVDDEGKAYVVIGVIDTTEAKEKEAEALAQKHLLEEQERELARRTVLSEYFLSSYSTAYYLNLTNNEYDVLKTNGIITDMAKSDDTIENGALFDTLVSVYIDGYVHPDDQDRVRTILSNENIRRQLEVDEEINFMFRDVADHEPGIYRGTIIRGEDANHVGIGFKNITEEVRQQEEEQQQLAQALSMAESANQSKSNFLFNMSHDIRTPMNAITGFTNMAKKHIDDREKVADSLNKIDASGKQLLSLINQVLEMARIESGKVELELKPINVGREFNSAVTVLSEQAKNKGLEFVHSASGIKHNDVLADVARVSSITLNITGNAMKYTPRGGKIEYNLREIAPRKEGYATFVFTVEDTGIGMSEDYQKVLFDPFTREKNSTVSKIQGTGLGMSIVKDLVDLMAGDIEVHSEPGKGTRFDITLDFEIVENVVSEDSVDTEELKASFAGKRLLLVEDNELNREIAIDILDEEGFVVEEAEDGTVAVELLKEKGPDYYDFILMDIQMPVMNGYEATKAIRDMYPSAKLPIIALSANAFSEDKEKSLEAGMDEHVAKPIEIGDLFKALMKFI